MGRLTAFQGYTEYRDAVAKALVSAEEDFVYIGYLLRRAKENPVIMAGSPYENYKDFAKGEFNLDESMVSRFIGINEKYADGAELLPQYRGFGVSKLGEMLSLPPMIAEQLTPDTTREEIRGIKADIKENEKVTPIERYAERAQLSDEDGNEIYRFFVDYFKTHKDEWLQLRGWLDDLNNAETVSDVLFPNGEGIIRANIKGEGSCMIKSRGTDEDLTITYFADGRKEMITWNDLMDAIYDAGSRESDNEFTEELWESLYGKKIAPAQKATPTEENSHLTTAPTIAEAEKSEENLTEGTGEKPENTPMDIEKDLNPPTEDEEDDQILGTSEENGLKPPTEGTLEGTVEDIPEDEKKVSKAIEDIRKYIKAMESYLYTLEHSQGDDWKKTQHQWIDIKNLADYIKDTAKKEEQKCGAERIN